jgi:signal transduction histidine kinase
MEWFKPSSQTVSFLAETCLLITVLFYIVNLKQKSRDTYLCIGYILTTLGFSIIAFFFNSMEAPNWLRILVFFSWLAEALYRIMFAYIFCYNPFRKEMIYAMIIAGLGLLYSSILNLNYILISNLLAALWGMIVFCRKTFREASARQISIASVEGKESGKTRDQKSFPNELLQPSDRKVKAYKGFIIWAFLYVVLWTLFNIQAANGWNLSIFSYSYHTLLLMGAIQSVFVFLNYAKEKNSLKAKLVWVILCAVLIILGLLPYALFGDAFPTAENPHEESRLYIFLWLIPSATALTVFIAPIVFRNNILRPLQRVVDGVKGVNEGDLSVNVKVEVNDEIGVLSEDFNRMTESLRKYADNMAELVDERTAQLKASLENLKATQAQLIQSEKMASLGELTAGIAHEIQNPLNFVNNFSEVNKEMLEELKAERLKPKAERDDGLQNDLIDDVIANEEKINHHGKRADAIVKGMLQHSRVSSGQKELTDINALCDEYLRLCYHGLRAKDKSFNATLETDFDNTIGKINVVSQDIARVLLNIFNNAFYAVNEKKKSGPPVLPINRDRLEGGTGKLQNEYMPLIIVGTKLIPPLEGKREAVEIKVADNGNGIPQNIIDKIFQPFFTTKPTGQGTGLGLSLAYDIIKAHGGEIKVETKEGEGSEFIVQLPLT